MRPKRLGIVVLLILSSGSIKANAASFEIEINMELSRINVGGVGGGIVETDIAIDLVSAGCTSFGSISAGFEDVFCLDVDLLALDAYYRPTREAMGWTDTMSATVLIDASFLGIEDVLYSGSRSPSHPSCKGSRRFCEMFSGNSYIPEALFGTFTFDGVNLTAIAQTTGIGSDTQHVIYSDIGRFLYQGFGSNTYDFGGLLFAEQLDGRFDAEYTITSFSVVAPVPIGYSGAMLVSGVLIGLFGFRMRRDQSRRDHSSYGRRVCA